MRWKGYCESLRRGDRCGGNIRYYGINDTSTYWSAYFHLKDSNMTGVGPLYHGLENPGCMDCGGCKGYGETSFIEYLGVEFSKDVAVQLPPNYLYTQEVVYQLYLRPRTYDAIVINTGLHDLLLCAVDFTRNLNWTFALIKKYQIEQSDNMTQFIWLTITAVNETLVPEVHKNFTNNDRVDQFNNIATPLAKRYGFTVFDANSLSRQHNFADSKHPCTEYFVAGLDENFKLSDLSHSITLATMDNVL